MNFEASLLPVLGGYWLLTHLVPTRTESLRRSGYHIAFQSAVVGVVLLGAAYLTLLGVEEWCGWLKADFENAAMVSAGVGLLAPHVLNRFFDQGKWEERVAARYGDLVELLIARAIKRSRLLGVSLKSGKSYIGFAVGNTISRWPEADLALLPVSSGYRHRDTQDLVITTHYAPAMRDHFTGKSVDAFGESLRDFRVVIPRSEIVSARLFDPDFYQRFQSSSD